jgi:hypothetical protein
LIRHPHRARHCRRRPIGRRLHPGGHVVQLLVTDAGPAAARAARRSRPRGHREVLEGAGGVPVEDVVEVGEGQLGGGVPGGGLLLLSPSPDQFLWPPMF